MLNISRLDEMIRSVKRSIESQMEVQGNLKKKIGDRVYILTHGRWKALMRLDAT